MLRLWFTSFDSPQLVRTQFAPAGSTRPIVAVRGKTPGCYNRGQATFQWTQGVQALAGFLLRAALESRTGAAPLEGPLLSGGFGSPAASLDYAVGKPPGWLIEMFGETRAGEPVVRRLVTRTNPERKRGGDVELGLNRSILRPADIHAFVADVELQTVEEFRKLAAAIDRAWKGSEKVRPPSAAAARRDEAASAPNQFAQVLYSIYSEESVRTLQYTDIFTRSGLARVHSRIERDLSVPGAAHSFKELVAATLAQHDSTSRLGVVSPELKRKLLDAPPIQVALPCGNPGATEIFNFLRWNERLPFSVDYRFHYAIEIMHKILEHKFAEPPGLCLIGLAPAATMVAQSARTGYRPIMVMPAVSHRVVAPVSKAARPAGRISRGDYVFLSEEFSTSQIYFDLLSYAGELRADRVTARHAEPDEAFKWLKDGEEDRRALLFFPYYAINRRMNNCSYLDDIRGDIHLKDFILFAHESLIADRMLIQAICAVIRDAWLRLRSGGREYQETLRRTFNERDFTGTMLRFSGADSA